MDKKKFLITGTALIILILILLLFFLIQGEEKPPFDKNQIDKTKETNLLLKQREGYGISSAVFSELPVPPKDFNKIVSLYHQGKFNDEMFFSEKYFSQPEFYPSFLANGLTYWQQPVTTHYGAYGYGSFPIKKTIVLKKGEEFKGKFFVHSGYGVRTFQGIQLNSVFDKGEEFFDVIIKEPVFLLEPNFPKLKKGWAKDVLFDVQVKENAPEGFYSLKIFVSSPPEELSEKWSKEHEKYFDAATFSTDKPLFELQIIVE